MKYAAEIGSSAMVYVSSFIKFCSDIQTLTCGDSHTHGQTDIQTAWRSHKPNFISSK
jgi:hypothetical protein